MLGQSNGCFDFEDVALKREMFCEEIVTDEWYTVWRPFFITGVIKICQMVHFCVQWPVLECYVD